MIAKRVALHARGHEHPSLLVRCWESPLHARVSWLSSRGRAVAGATGAIGVASHEGAGGCDVAEVFERGGVADGAGIWWLGDGEGEREESEDGCECAHIDNFWK